MPQLRIGFAGTPNFASQHLSCLLDSGYTPVAVYTQPDRPSGRGKKLTPSPVKTLAEINNIAVYQPVSLKTIEAQQQFADLNLDLLIVVAYGLILPRAILDTPTYGCINVHASLLPRWRGAAPIERALLAGDTETGVTIMAMDEGLDTGKMIHKVEVEITKSDTREDLETKLIQAGSAGLLFTLNHLEEALANAIEQNEADATYAAKLNKTESLINFATSAFEIDRVIRAGIGRLPAFSFYNNDRLRIIKASPSPDAFDKSAGTIVSVSKDSFVVACQDSSLTISVVQLPGKNPVTVTDLRNSKPDYFRIGSQFETLESFE